MAPHRARCYRYCKTMLDFADTARKASEDFSHTLAEANFVLTPTSTSMNDLGATIASTFSLPIRSEEAGLVASVAFLENSVPTTRSWLYALPLLGSPEFIYHDEIADHIARTNGLRKVGRWSMLMWSDSSATESSRHYFAACLPIIEPRRRDLPSITYDTMLSSFLACSEHIPNVTFIHFGPLNTAAVHLGKVIAVTESIILSS